MRTVTKRCRTSKGLLERHFLNFSEHWIDQGRQSHGWFGNGTSANKSEAGLDFTSNGLFSPTNVKQRVGYAAYSLIGHVPSRDRGRMETLANKTGRESLNVSVAAWYDASNLTRDAFRNQLLDPYTSDENVDQLRSAALGIVEARSHAELGVAVVGLAAAIQRIEVEQ